MVTRASVIIPAYNAELTIGRAVESSLSEVSGGDEVIVVNDGSTDSTREILEAFGSRIKLINQPNCGRSAARNAAVSASAGEYLAFLDADDIWLPGRLDKTVAPLAANPLATLAFCHVRRVGEDGDEMGLLSFAHAPSLGELLSSLWDVLPSGVTMRRSAFESCGGFREGYGEDAYLWLLARELGEFVHVPEPLVIYRSRSLHTALDGYPLDGRRSFETAVQQRYGRRATGLIRELRAGTAALLLALALAEVDSGEYGAAWQACRRFLNYQPTYVLRPRILARAFRLRNLRRLLAASTFLRSEPRQ
jgi:glycosyltransferase involved in cell wall biosynthesis